MQDHFVTEDQRCRWVWKASAHWAQRQRGVGATKASLKKNLYVKDHEEGPGNLFKSPSCFSHIPPSHASCFLPSDVPLKLLASPFSRAALSTLFSPSPVLFSRVRRQSLYLWRAEDGSRLQLNQILTGELSKKSSLLVSSYI